MKLINTKQNKKNSKKLDDSMIPAINIVFLLLIFFMIAGKIENRDTKLHIPKSISKSEFIKQEINIKVDSDGEYIINDIKVEDSLINEFELLSLNENTIITCHIHNELPISKLDPILEVMQTLGIKKINIATQGY